MIRATRNDKLLIIDLLSAAFEDNLSVNFFVLQDEKRKERIRALMDYSFEVCYRFGSVLLSEDRKACALVTYPHKKKSIIESAWLDLILIFRAVGVNGIKKALDREAKIKAKQSKEPMAYLWFIGVNPMYQHSGFGSNLLKEVIEDAEHENLPVFLETSTLQNLPWYRRFGFQVYDELDLTYNLYFLKRDLSK